MRPPARVPPPQDRPIVPPIRRHQEYPKTNRSQRNQRHPRHRPVVNPLPPRCRREKQRPKLLPKVNPKEPGQHRQPVHRIRRPALVELGDRSVHTLELLPDLLPQLLNPKRPALLSKVLNLLVLIRQLREIPVVRKVQEIAPQVRRNLHVLPRQRRALQVQIKRPRHGRGKVLNQGRSRRDRVASGATRLIWLHPGPTQFPPSRSLAGRTCRPILLF